MPAVIAAILALAVACPLHAETLGLLGLTVDAPVENGAPTMALDGRDYVSTDELSRRYPGTVFARDGSLLTATRTDGSRLPLDTAGGALAVIFLGLSRRLDGTLVTATGTDYLPANLMDTFFTGASGPLGDQLQSTWRQDLDTLGLLGYADALDQAAAPSARTGVVDVRTTLNVRPTPGTNGDPIGSLNPGDRVTILGQQGNWLNITFNGGSGWVSADYVKADGPSAGGTPPTSQQPQQPQQQQPSGAAVFTNIYATSEEGQASAFGGTLRDGEVFAALPSRKAKNRRIVVRYKKTGKTCESLIRDVGPWNIDDPYWEKPGGRPAVEATGYDRRGRRSNKAGIDLSFELWYRLGVSRGQAYSNDFSDYVDWWFVD